MRALEKWIEAEGAAAGADPQALKSISDAMAKRDATAAAQRGGEAAAGNGGGWELGVRKRQGTAGWLKTLPPDIAARCVGTAGDWCGRYLMQTPVPPKVLLWILTRSGSAYSSSCNCAPLWTLPDATSRSTKASCFQAKISSLLMRWLGS